ncbi:Murein DD-endopeptidase MepM [compost metagenome]
MKFRFKFKPVNRRYTVLIVPEGSNPVFRLKFRLSFLLTALITSIILIATILLLFIINRNHSYQIHTLKSELFSSTSQYQSTVDDKEQAIDKLLKELVELSEKSKTIEGKLIELEQLEAELKSITGKDHTSNEVNTTYIEAAKESTYSLGTEDFVGGIGGESIPLSDEEITSLVNETKESITASLSEIPDLQQKLEKTKVTVQQYKEMMQILPTYWPTDSVRVTSQFGKRKDPFSGVLSLHSGLDIGGQIGDPIYAAANGTVKDTGYSSARGNYVTISHPSGLETNYMHLSKVSVSKGDKLKQGDPIGELGSTGRSTGPHLHLEVVKNGVTIDPELYLQVPGEDEDL